MKIGTDVSLQICKSEGYMIIEFDGRKPFTVNIEIKCLNYWPEYDFLAGEIRLSDYFDAISLFEIYTDNKKDIDNFIGGSHVMPDDYYSFLNLASDLDSYLGLNGY